MVQELELSDTSPSTLKEIMKRMVKEMLKKTESQVDKCFSQLEQQVERL